jgi:arginine deiminase
VIKVNSDIGRLRRVLVHRPGLEIDWMVPRMMEQLLFDDILYGQQARREHGRFCRVMQSAGVEVLDAGTMLTEALESPAARDEITAEVGSEMESDALVRLRELAPADLAKALVHGVRRESPRTGGRVFDLDPVPNYFFQRDPQIAMGDRLVISAMATEARSREPRLSRLLFSHHPMFAGQVEVLEILPWGTGGDSAPPELEGGDVIVAREDTLLVGISQRTNRRGVERLARHLQREKTTFRHLVLVDLPPRRSYMHLDTVFTLVDEAACLAFLPVIESGRRESAGAYYVDLEAGELRFAVRDSLLDAMSRLGWDLEVVPCGGSGDLINQEREQWTDGANAFALAPGVIMVYERNRRTVDELDSMGWRVLSESEVLDGAEVLGQGPTVVTVPGHELSRARGGPHCMTMALERDPL